ncbi:MAG TPA: hypothetical protein VGB82_21845 [Alphaproteobacteria bacterium]
MATRSLTDCIRGALGGAVTIWEFMPEDQFGATAAVAGPVFADFLNVRCVDRRLKVEIQGSREALAKLGLRPNRAVDGVRDVHVLEGPCAMPFGVAVKFAPVT